MRQRWYRIAASDAVSFTALVTCRNTVTFRVKLSERLLWSDFYSRLAAIAVGHLEIGSTRFGPGAVADQ